MGRGWGEQLKQRRGYGGELKKGEVWKRDLVRGDLRLGGLISGTIVQVSEQYQVGCMQLRDAGKEGLCVGQRHEAMGGKDA